MANIEANIAEIIEVDQGPDQVHEDEGRRGLDHADGEGFDIGGRLFGDEEFEFEEEEPADLPGLMTPVPYDICQEIRTYRPPASLFLLNPVPRNNFRWQSAV
jgi:hypothetical protein